MRLEKITNFITFKKLDNLSRKEKGGLVVRTLVGRMALLAIFEGG